MTDRRHDELSTADLADKRPRGGERFEDDRTDVTDDAGSRESRPREGSAREHDERVAAETGMTDQRPDSGHRPEPEPDEDRPRAVRRPDGDGFGGDRAATTSNGPLLAAADAERFRARWTDVQTGFVDAPRRAVERADELVADVMQRLATTFADERGRLEGQWDRGDEVSTDDLRTAFQRYRSFFERLLKT
ncbi:MAG TPA: hypothetical protein VFA45_11655 [Actinomycetes bacterium]|jgi:hypothetical protein|nr:hypothetical protein [Actinomycetes bacterium]